MPSHCGRISIHGKTGKLEGQQLVNWV